MAVGADRVVSVADAKAHLSELIAAAEAGETVVITRRGEAVAELSARQPSRKPGKRDLSWLFEATAKMEYSDVDSADLIRQMRDERY